MNEKRNYHQKFLTLTPKKLRDPYVEINLETWQNDDGSVAIRITDGRTGESIPRAKASYNMLTRKIDISLDGYKRRSTILL
jgi:hypothetical protein